MRKLFERLRKSMEDFIGQRDDFLMLALCSENDAPPVLSANETKHR